jgi:hypothetical protein
MENQDKVKSVMDKTGCTLEQASLSLDYSSGDVEKAVELIVSVERFIFAIKGRFISRRMNVRGIFVIMANVKEGRIERMGLLATNDSRFYLPDVNGKWDEFEESMYVRKLGEGVAQSISRDMQENIQSIIATEKGSFFQMLRDMEIEKLEEVIAWEIDKAVNRVGGMEVKISIEQINLYEFKGIAKDEKRKKEEKEKAEAAPSPSMEVILQVNLTLDPVGGVQVSDLKKGDMVEAVVVDNREVAYHLADAFGGTRGNVFVPVVVPVESLFPSESGQMRVSVRLYKDILGSAAIASEVKVRLISHTQEEGEIARPLEPRAKDQAGMSVAAFLIAGTATLLILVGLFLLLVFK